jgi:hypothetical protein
MKKRIVSVLLIAMLICVCVVCIYVFSLHVDGSVLIPKGEITEIRVRLSLEEEEYTFTGDSAKKIIDYLSDLSLISDFEEDPEKSNGAAWFITLVYEDGREICIYHIGNKFIRNGESDWYKMYYRQAEKFDKLMDELK